MKDNTLLYPTLMAILILTGAEAVYMMKERRHDNKDMFSSFGLTLGAIPISFITTGIIIFTYSLIYQFRFFTIPSDHWWVWVILFFGDDISYYWYHRMSHQIRFLWASHMVHHSSEKFTFSSGLRVPWTSNLTGTFLFWAWMPLMGIEPYMVIFMKSISVIYQFWMHTETIRKMPKWFEAVFNTPSHHRVHHSSNVEYLDKNHAGTLIIWDKLFGTYQEELFKPKYGLTEDIKSYNPFVIAFHEWRKILKDLKKVKKLKDRFHYIFSSPGWSHDGSSKTTKQLQAEMNMQERGTENISFENLI
jgi:sterol desaturase/sphingolipid hydroxylase (fatty acid hydroxylase superfamily)